MSKSKPETGDRHECALLVHRCLIIQTLRLLLKDLLADDATRDEVCTMLHRSIPDFTVIPLQTATDEDARQAKAFIESYTAKMIEAICTPIDTAARLWPANHS